MSYLHLLGACSRWYLGGQLRGGDISASKESLQPCKAPVTESLLKPPEAAQDFHRGPFIVLGGIGVIQSGWLEVRSCPAMMRSDQMQDEVSFRVATDVHSRFHQRTEFVTVAAKGTTSARTLWILASGLAKSTKFLHGRTLGGYRHEFGSLMEAAMDISGHPERDLILHLIAAHHGWARPHFEPTALDNTYTTEDNERAAVEVLRRFGRLQQRFGHWGLAWLEALLRCADIAASKLPTEVPSRTRPEEVQV